MPYQRQHWNDYDETVSETINIERGAVVTPERLNKLEIGITQNYTELDSKKADRSYVDAVLSSIAAGGPRGLFLSVAALKVAYPSGADGTYLVFDASHMDGAHIYIWDGTKWVDLGIYQERKINDSTVTLSKIFLDGYLPLILQYKYGRESGTSTQWANANVPSLKKDTVINSKKSDLEFMIYRNNGSDWVGVIPTWQKQHTIVEDVSNLKIVARFNPERVIAEVELDRISSWIEIITEDTALKRKEITPIYDKLAEYEGVPLELGAIDGNGVSQGVGNGRLRNINFTAVENGETLVNNDKANIEIAVAKRDGVAWYTNPAWTDQDILFDFSGEIRYMIRKKSGAVFTGDDIKNYSEIIGIRKLDRLAKISEVREIAKGNAGGTSQSNIFYVSPNGSDINDGSIESTPLKTFQKAIDLGATKIYAKRGNYYNQSFFASNYDTLEIRPYERDSYSSSNYDVRKIKLINATIVSTPTLTNGLYTIPYTGNELFEAVFVTKTLPPETISSRPSYNVGLWQNHIDISLDQKIKPVLDMQEVLDTPGTFTWENNLITINPHMNPSGLLPVVFAIVEDNRFPVQIENCQKVALVDVVSEYGFTQNFRLHNIQEIYVQNCESHYTNLEDGFSIHYTNGHFHNCTASRSRNDGFNMHGFGDTHFWGCTGFYNGDDGISHHYGCTGSITGGEWYSNGKAGIASPTYGSIVHLYQNYCHDNTYGIYAVGDSNNPHRTIRMFDNVSLNNTDRDIALGGNYTVLGKNNIFETITGESRYTDLLSQ